MCFFFFFQELANVRGKRLKKGKLISFLTERRRNLWKTEPQHFVSFDKREREHFIYGQYYTNSFFMYFFIFCNLCICPSTLWNFIPIVRVVLPLELKKFGVSFEKTCVGCGQICGGWRWNWLLVVDG